MKSAMRIVVAVVIVGTVGLSGWLLGRWQGLQAQMNQTYNDAVMEAYSALSHVRVLRESPGPHSERVERMLYSSLAAALLGVENEIAVQSQVTPASAFRNPIVVWRFASTPEPIPMTLEDLQRQIMDIGLSRAELTAALVEFREVEGQLWQGSAEEGK